MKYVLAIWVFSHHWYGPVSVTGAMAEFDTLAACAEAGRIQERWLQLIPAGKVTITQDRRNVLWACLEKSTP